MTSQAKCVTTLTKRDADSLAVADATSVRSVVVDSHTGGARPNVRPVVPHHPLQRNFFDQWLNDYDDRVYVLEGIDYGVDIGYRGCQAYRESPNWPSIATLAQDTFSSISKDLSKGRVSGPFDEIPHPDFVASPLGAFRRKRSGKVRVIHDLSWPPGNSINDGINPDDYSLQYISVDYAVQLCLDIGLGRPVYLAQLDLMDAFKQIFVRPAARHLLGFTWDPSLVGGQGSKQYFYSNVLEFGLRSSPAIFDRFASALQYIMAKHGAGAIARYMDDYCTVAETRDACQASLDIMLDTCRQAGFEVQPHKVKAPATVMEFLGIVIDTERRELRISDERLTEITELTQEWQNRNVCSKRELLSLMGKLLFVSRVVRSGRTFVGRLITLSKRVRHLHHKIKLN